MARPTWYVEHQAHSLPESLSHEPSRRYRTHHHRKIAKQLSWTQLADIIGHSKEWSTAALLGQMTLTAEQAQNVGAALDLPASLLQVVPYKGSLPTSVPTKPADLSVLRTDQCLWHHV